MHRIQINFPGEQIVSHLQIFGSVFPDKTLLLHYSNDLFLTSKIQIGLIHTEGERTETQKYISSEL